MNDPIRRLKDRVNLPRQHQEDDTPPTPTETRPVELAAAEMLLLGGLGVAAAILGGSRDEAADEGPLRPIAWGGVLLGAAAAAAHAVHATSSDGRARTATRIFDVAAVAAGLLGAVEESARGRPGGARTLAGLTLASAGVMGMLVDRAGASFAADRARLERRASIMERFVPKRRTRLDRIVVHV